MNLAPSSRMLSPDDLTADWFTKALGTEVVDAEIKNVIWGTATKVLMRLSYAQPGETPTDVCVKGPFDERLAEYGIEAGYVTEARFFADLAPTLNARLPRSWYAEDGVVIFDDLTASGCTFGDPLEPWAPDLVAVALEQQAAWHRQGWGGTAPNLESLNIGSEVVRSVGRQLLSPGYWDQHFASDGAPRLPVGVDDRERILRAFEALWVHDETGIPTFAHGDAHIGNTYLDAEGRPGFLDWQTVCRAPSFYDVAYFMSGALSVDDRRSTEEDLVRHYLAALAANGGPTLSFDEAWLDYRRYTLHGFLWAVTPPTMQTPARVRAMGERHAAAIADHDSISLLAG